MASCPILSCSAPVGMTFQLLACLACVLPLAACSHESPARSSRESLFFLHTLELIFTLSHSLPLQESYLNTGLLIAKIQVNLVRNPTRWLIKFNLTDGVTDPTLKTYLTCFYMF